MYYKISEIIYQEHFNMAADFWGQLKALLEGLVAAGRLDSNTGPISRYKVAPHKHGDLAAVAAAGAAAAAMQPQEQAPPVEKPSVAPSQVRGFNGRSSHFRSVLFAYWEVISRLFSVGVRGCPACSRLEMLVGRSLYSFEMCPLVKL